MNPGDDLADNFALLNIVEIVREVVNFPMRNDENFQNFQRRMKKVYLYPMKLDFKDRIRKKPRFSQTASG